MRVTLALTSLFSALVCATPAPAYPGYKVIWSDTFPGNPGDKPNTSKWNIITEYASAPWYSCNLASMF